MRLAQKQDSKDPKVLAEKQYISMRFNMDAKPKVIPPVKADWLLANMTDDGPVPRQGRPAKGARSRTL